MISRLTVICIASFLLFAYPVMLRAEEGQNATFGNEFVKVVVNKGPQETGRFSIDTTGGDPTLPSGKNQQLIYGGKTPWTSISSVRIDDKTFVFGGITDRRSGLNAEYGELLSGPTVKGDSISCSYKFGDIVVTQNLSLLRGISSHMLDSVGITYKIENQGAVSHQVGIRLMLDTKLGPNDGAPIRAGGSEAIQTATTLIGNEIPDYWMASDSFIAPTVVSQGTLKGSGLTPPDKIIFADWGTLADDIWEPALNPDQGFIREGEDEEDTATAMLWKPVTIQSGSSKSYTTSYGIGYLDIHPGKLAISIASPSETIFEYEKTIGFTVMGYVTNSGDFEGKKINLTIKLPEGLSLDEGSESTITRQSLKPNEVMQASWKVIANGEAGGELPITLEATSANIQPNTGSKIMQVNVPEAKLTFHISSPKVPTRENNNLPKTAFVEVKLKPASNFNKVKFTVNYDSSILRLSRFAPVYMGPASAVKDGDQPINDTFKYELSDGKIIITAPRGNSASKDRFEIILATIPFIVRKEGICPLTLENAVLVSNDGEETPVAVGNGQIEVKD